MRTRFAPSPTGRLHLGGLRTALFSRLLAGRKGSFVLRIEDTDRKRLVPGAATSILDNLQWVGLSPDEGFGSHYQPFGPYIQSERLHLYHKIGEELVEVCLLPNHRLA